MEIFNLQGSFTNNDIMVFFLKISVVEYWEKNAEGKDKGNFR